MKQLSVLQHNSTGLELLSPEQLFEIKGGLFRDDKRRQRPGGGTTTTSPSSYISRVIKFRL
jgi:hypothetical protein